MYTIKHLITGYDVLPDGRLKPSAILKYMQDAATQDAANLGCDYKTMRQDDMIFVITKALVTYNRVPVLDDELVIRTWNGSISGVSFNRDFVMTVGDEVVARATTRWVLVSYTGRRILRPDTLRNSVLTNCDEAIGIEPERRIKLTADKPILTFNYKPTLSDLDSNLHVNNTRYGDYMIDHCNVDLLNKDIKAFEIHYSSELKYGEDVCFATVVDGNKIYVVGDKADEKQAFSSFIEVKDK